MGKSEKPPIPVSVTWRNGSHDNWHVARRLVRAGSDHEARRSVCLEFVGRGLQVKETCVDYAGA